MNRQTINVLAGRSWVREAGFVAGLLGVLIMLSGRFVARAPHLMIYAGLGLVLLSWGLFIYSALTRATAVRDRPKAMDG